MPGIILDIQVQNRSCLKGVGRQFGKFQKKAMEAAAADWHERILPRHFTPGNNSRYRMAKRSALYERVIKRKIGVGQGKFVSLTLKGRSQRFMQAFFTITGSKDRITLRMKPPGYFTNPFIGTYKDPQTGKTKRITRQPDKPAETTRTTDEDRLRLRKVVERNLVRMIRDFRATQAGTP